MSYGHGKLARHRPGQFCAGPFRPGCQSRRVVGSAPAPPLRLSAEVDDLIIDDALDALAKRKAERDRRETWNPSVTRIAKPCQPLRAARQCVVKSFNGHEQSLKSVHAVGIGLQLSIDAKRARPLLISDLPRPPDRDVQLCTRVGVSQLSRRDPFHAPTIAGCRTQTATRRRCCTSPVLGARSGEGCLECVTAALPSTRKNAISCLPRAPHFRAWDIYGTTRVGLAIAGARSRRAEKRQPTGLASDRDAILSTSTTAHRASTGRRRPSHHPASPVPQLAQRTIVPKREGPDHAVNVPISGAPCTAVVVATIAFSQLYPATAGEPAYHLRSGRRLA